MQSWAKEDYKVFFLIAKSLRKTDCWRELQSYAVTRIRTEVAAATTQSTNHYTITACYFRGGAVRLDLISFETGLSYCSFLYLIGAICTENSKCFHSQLRSQVWHPNLGPRILRCRHQYHPLCWTAAHCRDLRGLSPAARDRVPSRLPQTTSLFPLQIFKAFGLGNQSICLFTPPPGTLELIFLFPECWNRKRSGAGELRKALRSLYFFLASLTVPWRPLSETKDSWADFSKSKSPQSIQKNK